jgi:hypothetical protein
MNYKLIESIVRVRLRERKGQAYCRDCLAKDLQQDLHAVKEAADALVRLAMFRAGRCPCGKAGVMYAG